MPGPVQHFWNPGRGNGASFKIMFSFSLPIWIGCEEVCSTVLSHISGKKMIVLSVLFTGKMKNGEMFHCRALSVFHHRTMGWVGLC